MMLVALAVAWVTQTLFLFGYGFRRRWWRSWEGAALLTSSVGWSLASGGFLVDLYVRSIPDRWWVLTAATAAVAGCLKFWILVASSRPPKRSRRAEVEAS